MKRLTALATAALIAAAPVAASAETPMLVMVTSPDTQVQLMSMVLTLQAAQQGAAARVLLCGAAADMALRDAPASVTTGQPPKDLSPQGLMQTVMEKTGTQVEVCAIYLPGKGIDASALIDGVTAADPAAIGALLVDPATKVVTF
jgi:intracellular sulfur oxidation DsrE/DsrF family protein